MLASRDANRRIESMFYQSSAAARTNQPARNLSVIGLERAFMPGRQRWSLLAN